MYRPILISLLLTLFPYPTWCGPDPMRPVSIPESPASAVEPIDQARWQLNLIRQTGAARVALLNGQLLKVGGHIDGAQVIAIGAYNVTLRLADDRSLELTLPSVELRKNRD